jgi:tRNA-splicing endonuclease subunit Sen54
MPTLAELTHMYEGLPVIPPPLPRKRNPPSEKAVPVLRPYPPKGHDATSRPSFVARLLSYLSLYSSPPTPRPAPAKINPFAALRQGNKSVIIAVVDAGTVSFFKFGRGAFEEWPMAA